MIHIGSTMFRMTAKAKDPTPGRATSDARIVVDRSHVMIIAASQRNAFFTSGFREDASWASHTTREKQRAWSMIPIPSRFAVSKRAVVASLPSEAAYDGLL